MQAVAQFYLVDGRIHNPLASIITQSRKGMECLRNGFFASGVKARLEILALGRGGLRSTLPIDVLPSDAGEVYNKVDAGGGRGESVRALRCSECARRRNCRLQAAVLFCNGVVRLGLHRRHLGPLLDALVWKIRSWWSVQGASRETGIAMARALRTLEWSQELFEPVDVPPAGGEVEAVQRVTALVEQARAFGAPRREYSLASKVLHLLLPWRIPLYDSFVRSRLGVAEPADHPEQTYARVAHEIFRAARNVATTDQAWMGRREPRALFRAFDKYYWWVGGGYAASSPQVTNPWRVIEELGQDCS